MKVGRTVKPKKVSLEKNWKRHSNKQFHVLFVPLARRTKELSQLKFISWNCPPQWIYIAVPFCSLLSFLLRHDIAETSPGALPTPDTNPILTDQHCLNYSRISCTWAAMKPCARPSLHSLVSVECINDKLRWVKTKESKSSRPSPVECKISGLETNKQGYETQEQNFKSERCSHFGTSAVPAWDCEETWGILWTHFVSLQAASALQ